MKKRIFLEKEEDVQKIVGGSITEVTRDLQSMMFLTLADGRTIVILNGLVDIIDDATDTMSTIPLRHHERDLAGAMMPEIQKIVGWTITEAFREKDSEYYGFAVAKGSKEREVWVWRDPEGNGNGFLSISPATQLPDKTEKKERDCSAEIQKRIEAPPLEAELSRWWDDLDDISRAEQIFSYLTGLHYHWIPDVIREALEKDQTKRDQLPEANNRK